MKTPNKSSIIRKIYKGCLTSLYIYEGMIIMLGKNNTNWKQVKGHCKKFKFLPRIPTTNDVKTHHALTL